ncbi:NAD-dependent epimerase/dehydratase family protein [bacterium]|nr:NAD-dependent epimerase/dehydratase family protein [bacterium]
MKVLITGGAGYIGHSLMQALQQNAQTKIEEIVVYDNLSRRSYSFFQHAKFNNIPVRFIEAELLDERSMEKALKGIDTVVHLAAKVTTPFSDAESHFFDQVNHWGTALLVNCVLRNEQVKHFVQLSSATIYGRTEAAVDEDYEPQPFSFYGISKYNAEKQVKLLEDRCKVHIIRSGNVYGHNPSLRIDAVVNKYMFNAHFNGKIKVFGDGSQQRPFIHVDKLAAALNEVIAGKVSPGLYNVVEHNFSVNQVVAYMKHLYPELEVLSINYNVSMPRVLVKTPVKILEQISLPEVGFLEELRAFEAAFAF